MNGMQQAQAASIAALSIALAVASVPAISGPLLALLGAVGGFVLLFGMDGRPRPRPAFVANAPGPSPVGRQSTVFLRERGSDSTDDTQLESTSENGRPVGEDEPAEPAEPPNDDDHSAALSYEEFTARVAEEAETEEISFLPPYASGAGKTAGADAGGTSEPWDLDDVDDATGGSQSKMPMPRHFALGTVAVIRKLLEPDDVERILAEQRRYPRLRFGDIAVQLGLLTEPQLQEVLLAQQQGVFTDAEIRETRDRLRVFREAGTAGKR
jgi:hypothetical protein